MPAVPRQHHVTAFTLSRWQPHRDALANASVHSLAIVDAQKESIHDFTDKSTSCLLSIKAEGLPSGK
eukprot:1852044-Rhodomonas_salina.1